MAFDVQIADDVVLYINQCDRLTVSDRERILNDIKDELGQSADYFLEHNSHPFFPNRFWYDYFLATEAREVREFRFACSAEGHVYGVIEVLYADEYPVEE
jgi:hypothetical protein